MRSVIKKAVFQCFIALVASLGVYGFFRSAGLAIAVFSIVLAFVLFQIASVFINSKVKRTAWYNQTIGDCVKFRNAIPSGLDICNLGSTSAKYAFCYDGMSLRGANWALSPQTLSYDYRILRNYFSYLKAGACVLIPLCPFSGCIVDFEDDSYNYKYYPFLHPVLIRNYSEKTKKRIMRFVDSPFSVSPVRAILRMLRDIPNDTSSSMGATALKDDSSRYLASWKTQFSVQDLSASVSSEKERIIAINAALLEDIVRFCKERELKPIIVIPPVSPELSSALTPEFRENYIFRLVRNANEAGAVFLNYLDDSRFEACEYYKDAYLLNKSGQSFFSQILMNDLKVSEEGRK